MSADNTVWALAAEFRLPDEAVDPLLTRRRAGASDAEMRAAIVGARGGDGDDLGACLAMIDRILGISQASPPPEQSSRR